jgi:hypothetical protein
LVTLVLWDGLGVAEAGAVLGLKPATARTRFAPAKVRTPGGQVGLGWLLGLDDPDMYYGDDTGLVAQLKAMPNTVKARGQALEGLKAGKSQVRADATYSAGSPTHENPNFRRDLHTYAHWDTSSDADQIYAALGSYTLSVSATATSEHEAVLTWTGTNSTTLGSFAAWKSSSRAFFNSLVGPTGPMSQTTQHFSWQETVTW